MLTEVVTGSVVVLPAACFGTVPGCTLQGSHPGVFQRHTSLDGLGFLALHVFSAFSFFVLFIIFSVYMVPFFFMVFLP